MTAAKEPAKKVEVKKAPDPEPEPSTEDIIDDFVKSLDESDLTDEDKAAARLYLASRLTKYGFAVIQIKDPKDPELKHFSKMRLWSGNAGSKNPTLTELKNELEAARQKHRNYAADLGDATAEEFVEEILHRAGVPASEQRDDLKKWFAKALGIFVPDPFAWQNPLKSLPNPDDVA